MKISSFTDLIVWQNAHKLTLEIYRITQKFPLDEKFGITSQIKRAACSVPANIVEGFYRNTTKELINFLYISRGSCGECIYYLLLAKDVKFINEKQYIGFRLKYEIIIKQINALIKSLRSKIR